MAGRPPKNSLDYAGWDVSIFDNDRKIDKLLEVQGCTGFVVYFFLCQRAYGSEGYFYPWTCDEAPTTAKKIGGGVGSESVINTVNLCLRIGLFDNDLYARYKIITSRGIQKRFWQVAKTRTSKTAISEYWLLENEECEGLVKVALSQVETHISPGEMPISKGEMPISPPHNTTKESKVKYSKVKDNTIAQKRDMELFSGRSFTEPVIETLCDWIKYKNEKRQGYKATGLKNLLSQVENKLKEITEDQVIFAITESMACNYQGIIWDKAKQSAVPKTRHNQFLENMKEDFLNARIVDK